MARRRSQWSGLLSAKPHRRGIHGPRAAAAGVHRSPGDGQAGIELRFRPAAATRDRPGAGARPARGHLLHGLPLLAHGRCAGVPARAAGLVAAVRQSADVPVAGGDQLPLGQLGADGAAAIGRRGGGGAGADCPARVATAVGRSAVLCDLPRRAAQRWHGFDALRFTSALAPVVLLGLQPARPQPRGVRAQHFSASSPQNYSRRPATGSAERSALRGSPPQPGQPGTSLYGARRGARCL